MEAEKKMKKILRILEKNDVGTHREKLTYKIIIDLINPRKPIE